jgi:hypothetical protein
MTDAEFNDETEHNNHQMDAANDKVQTAWSTRRIAWLVVMLFACRPRC